MTSTLSLPAAKTLRLIGLLTLLLCTVLGIMTARSTALAYNVNAETTATTAAVVKLNDPLVTGGNIGTQQISPDNSTVVFRADAEIDGVNELYSVPIGGGTVTKLSPNTLTANREVLFTRLISADSSTVVYLADQNTDGVNELFSVPIGGGTVTQLNDPLPTGGGVGLFGIKLSPDGNTVVYSADQETNNDHEIFSVPIGGGTVTKLNSTLPSGGAIFEFQFTPDSSTVVYRGEQDTDGIDELFAVPSGGGTPIKVSEPGANLFFYEISADGSTVVYQTSTGGNGVDELFSAPIGSGTVTQLNGPLAVGETVGSFELSEDSSTVVYTTELFAEDEAPATGLYSVPMNGGTIIHLTGPFVADSGVGSVDISPDSSRVVFEADQDAVGVTELYNVPIGGGSTTKLNDPLVSGGDVQSFRFSPDSSIVLYRADQETDEVDELYSVSLDIALNLAPVAADDAYNTTPNTPLTVTAPGVMANDTDADDDALTAVLISNPSSGTVTLNANGSFTYTPNAGFTGSDSFTYQANDGTEDSNVATVTITVSLHNLYLPLVLK